MLQLEEARQRILDDLTPLGTEGVSLLNARGRVVAEPVIATRAQPPFDNSSMDGYAVIAADVATASADAPVPLTVIATLAAGQVSDAKLAPGQSMRIFTGAAMPAGADAVVMQEQTERSGDQVAIKVSAPVGQHIRRAGEDIAAGVTLADRGQVVRAGDIGAFAAEGRSWVEVVRAPRVAILPTGDELVEIDQTPGPGQIANSNSVMLAAQVEAAGCVPVRCPPAPDDMDGLAAALSRSAAGADLLLTCGGVSVGDFDHVREVLAGAGSVDFWRVAIKPGKPLAFGRLAGVPLIGLPGNPVSAFVCFELFARPALRKLAGFTDLLRPTRQVRLRKELVPNRNRREFRRGHLVGSDDGLWVELPSHQGSASFSSLLGVTVLLDVPAGEQTLPKGSELTALIIEADAEAEGIGQPGSG